MRASIRVAVLLAVFYQSVEGDSAKLEVMCGGLSATRARRWEVAVYTGDDLMSVRSWSTTYLYVMDPSICLQSRSMRLCYGYCVGG